MLTTLSDGLTVVNTVNVMFYDDDVFTDGQGGWFVNVPKDAHGIDRHGQPTHVLIENEIYPIAEGQDYDLARRGYALRVKGYPMWEGD